MGDVTMAIVSCTCVFMAVFIPVTFMGGTDVQTESRSYQTGKRTYQ